MKDVINKRYHGIKALQKKTFYDDYWCNEVEWIAPCVCTG